jgi:outer membrane protein assembly factor BamD (BamD/ComL family)
MFVVASVDELWDHIAYVMAYAPDNFPYRDFVAPDKQMNLDRAFEQLRDGIRIAYPENDAAEKHASLNALLDSAYAAYRNGECVQAGHILNEFQDSIFKRDDE